MNKRQKYGINGIYQGPISGTMKIQSRSPNKTLDFSSED